MNADEMDIVLGTANIGLAYGTALSRNLPTMQEVESRLKTAAALGIRYIDTAAAYGEAEERLGELISTSGLDSEFLVSTKTAPDLALSPTSVDDISSQTESCFQGSLERLRRESLDQLLLHRWSQFSACNGALWSLLQKNRASGKIGRLGVSVQGPVETLEAISEPAVETIQLACNLLDWRYDEPHLHDALMGRIRSCRVEVRSIFLQGLLAEPEKARFPKIDAAYDADQVRKWLRASAGEITGGNLSELCIRYAKALPWADALVIGVDSDEQLIDLVESFRKPALSEAEMNWVREKRPVLPKSFLDPAQWK